MKRISVQAFEDRGQADGGHAILLLDGVMSIPQRSTFKLRATEPREAGADGVLWQDSEIVALETRLGSKGIELVIGPDVAEDPGLMAGAVMELEIPEAGLRGEFMWPQITPRVRPKRRNIATVKPRRDGRPGDIMMRSDVMRNDVAEASEPDQPKGHATAQTANPATNDPSNRPAEHSKTGPAQTPPAPRELSLAD